LINTDRRTIEQKLERILIQVQKPGRYVGGEYNQIVKSWDSVKTHVALAFPDIYDIGISNLGMAILYEIVNQRDDVLLERVYSPWVDMETLMRKEQIPLFSLESKTPIRHFDILGISLPYETLYTNALNLLDLAGIPLRSSERTIVHPLVIAGGQAVFNPEPMAEFIDAFVIGEGEDAIIEVINRYQEWKQEKSSRQRLLEMLSTLSGVYVPSLYQPEYNEDGTLRKLAKLYSNAPDQILKRFCPKLPEPPTRFLVPNIDVVHNRVSIEIMRGCSRGCRFCHAGMVNRPVRERPVDEIIRSIILALEHTGFEEIALLSLSSSDYSQILDLVDQIQQHFLQSHLKISLPSLRIETFSVGLMDKIAKSRPGGFTLAPEAATERMRNIINKPISTEQLIHTAGEVYRRGWKTLKLYFLIGQPNEQIEDVKAIADLCKNVLYEGRKHLGRKAELHIGISTFVPKPHTPFQWASCNTEDQIQEKQKLLLNELRNPGIKVTWTSPAETMLESWLTRGDRRMGNVIYQAWNNGARFDAWQDRFDLNAWSTAFQQTGLSPHFYTHRLRSDNEVFPWDHIHIGVTKSHLLKEFKKSLNGVLTPNCAEHCSGCGILHEFGTIRRDHPGNYWKCPELTA